MTTEDLILTEIKGLNEAINAVKLEIAELRGGLAVRCTAHSEDIGRLKVR